MKIKIEKIIFLAEVLYHDSLKYGPTYKENFWLVSLLPIRGILKVGVCSSKRTHIEQYLNNLLRWFKRGYSTRLFNHEKDQHLSGWCW